jgi:riboflavin synthase
VGEVVALEDHGESADLRVRVPAEIERYLVMKGSVAVDGVSLTVAGLEGRVFTVALIPYTLQVTSLQDLRAGDPVNLEADVIAKYVERLLASGAR